MPLIKIEFVSGKTDEFKGDLIRVVGDVAVATLGLLRDDRNIRLVEYAGNMFVMKKPYEYIIEITLFKGRTKETKKLLYRKMVQALEEKLGIEKEKVFIVLNEQPLENWGVRGGYSAEDIKLGFEVER